MVGLGVLSEVPRSHTETPHSVGLLWTSDEPIGRPIHDSAQHSQETESVPPAGFEPAIPESERPQSHASERATTRIDRGYV